MSDSGFEWRNCTFVCVDSLVGKRQVDDREKRRMSSRFSEIEITLCNCRKREKMLET